MRQLVRCDDCGRQWVSPWAAGPCGCGGNDVLPLKVLGLDEERIRSVPKHPGVSVEISEAGDFEAISRVALALKAQVSRQESHRFVREAFLCGSRPALERLCAEWVALEGR